jgi:hypothetical protein
MDLLTGQPFCRNIFMDIKKPFQILDSVGMAGCTIILMMRLKYEKGKILLLLFII